MLFEKTYGIDLGSSSVKVYSLIRNKSYLEKNMIASKGRRIIAVGNEAYEMFEKAPVGISVTSPMSFGMIANLELQEIVLYSMMRRIDKILGIGSVMYFAVPLDIYPVERQNTLLNRSQGSYRSCASYYIIRSPAIPGWQSCQKT